MPRLHRRHQTGFTLVEVMIAIMIMAIISLISWQGLDSASRADEQLRQRSSHLSRQIRALQQLQQDIALRATVELPRTVISQSEAGGSGPAETTATPPAAQVANSPSNPCCHRPCKCVVANNCLFIWKFFELRRRSLGNGSECNGGSVMEPYTGLPGRHPASGP
ncbi:prepilin-type N-terminal cleavage/methylation domain-containing protein [Paenalcaligenes niemegkensis]|uniref:PulJ/GspJ family protein n=1 Tax=Paenalcaligenes niemegkensis TaxID=2895469 RepID=UPI001EE79568|nr:prepilin-type N-terminal cleavage/methylation domain-containing protein [Paenalcaligenes niemegkensis]MCQ9617048.1 prepilin-type N-terminal cleavage/methylation domain-containing protein [Paenalcaligenes niemegkensis]